MNSKMNEIRKLALFFSTMCSLFKKSSENTADEMNLMQSLKDKGRRNSVSVGEKSGGLPLSKADEKDTKVWTQTDRAKQDKCNYIQEALKLAPREKVFVAISNLRRFRDPLPVFINALERLQSPPNAFMKTGNAIIEFRNAHL
ncbi:hypothetical protein WR25_14925 [Diploscapter pachys]|uniref:Uncharacterized protein n=1 Tax=Diploscapter pachys TaxID=2018661 RepID=A0A2A2K6G0_9BILA|nr:hypothetical protein WR25_14925 [Diploscapter pachys]